MGAFGKAVDESGQGRDVICRPEKRPCNFRSVRRWCCVAGGHAPGRRLEVDLVARKRSVDEWLLFVVRRGHHVVSNVPEQEIDLEPGRLDMLEKCGNVRTIAPATVFRGGPAPRHKSDEHIVDWLYGRKPKHLHLAHSAG